MLYRCNIVGLVGGGTYPKYADSKLILWDDLLHRVTGEITHISKIRWFKMRKDIIAVSLEEKVMVYNMPDLELIRSHETRSNLYGVLAMSSKGEEPIIAMLGVKRGFAKVSFVKSNKEVDIECHQSEIRELSLNPDGTLLASAGTKGTLIRIYDTASGNLQRELRRGTESADIQWIAFSNSSLFIACTSDKGTAHVFSLKSLESDLNDDSPVADNEEEEVATSRKESMTLGEKSNQKNKESVLKMFKKVLPKYFSSEWSFKQIKIGGGKDKITKCGFTADDDIVLISNDGEYKIDIENTT